MLNTYLCGHITLHNNCSAPETTVWISRQRESVLNLAALDLAGLLLASAYVKRSQIKNTAATNQT